MKTSLQILKEHQAWRMGIGDAMPNSTKELTAAFQDAINALAERPVARASAVQMAGEIHRFRSEMGKAHGLKK